MGIVNKTKGTLLKNKHLKKLNHRLNAKKFYGKGVSKNGSSHRILFWTTGGMYIQTNLEGAIASALKLRGHKVQMIICDGVYKACAKRVDTPDVEMKDWGKYCRSCINRNSNLLDRLGIKYNYVSELVSKTKISDLRKKADEVNFENYKELSLNGINLSAHLQSAMVRHTRGGSFDGLEKLLKEYAFTVLVNAEASKAAIMKFKPDRVYMSHGIYADWGPALSESLHRKIPVSSYICSYLTAHFYFGTVKAFDDTFLKTSDEAWKKFKEEKFSEEQMLRIKNFLNRRYLNEVSGDMKGILKKYKGNKEYFINKYGLKADKPIWGIMTHINWDAVSDYFPMLYKDFDEWLKQTIIKISKIKDVQWLIKIHPSEINDNPETGCQKFIEKTFPELPSHIKILKMDDDISPFDFYTLIDGGVTVMGTGGLELSIIGKPVILAGKAHYSNKGFTFDAKNDKHYEELLGNAANMMPSDESKKALAAKYAYVHFMKKQIPLMPAIDHELHIDFRMLNTLIQGKNKFMDFLCDRIIDGKDFILPEELVKEIHFLENETLREFT